jgi:hypothetical protein
MNKLLVLLLTLISLSAFGDEFDLSSIANNLKEESLKVSLSITAIEEAVDGFEIFEIGNDDISLEVCHYCDFGKMTISYIEKLKLAELVVAEIKQGTTEEANKSFLIPIHLIDGCESRGGESQIHISGAGTIYSLIPVTSYLVNKVETNAEVRLKVKVRMLDYLYFVWAWNSFLINLDIELDQDVSL